jgi:hypothetical protein
MAFCEPCLSQSLVPAEFRGNLTTTQKSIEEWKQVFADYILAAGGEETSATEAPTQYVFPDPGLLALKTPKKVQQQLGDRLLVVPIELDDIVNQDESWWEEPEDEYLLPVSLLVFLRNVRGFLLRYDRWLQEPLETVARRMDTVANDLHRLKHHCDGLQKSLGRPLSLMGSDFPDVWAALEFLSADPRTVEDTGNFRQAIQDLQLAVNGIIEAQSHQAENKEHLIVMETLIAMHATRFEAIHPFLVKITELGNKLMVLDAQQARVPPPILQPSDPWLNQFGNPSQNTIPVVTPISSPTNAVATSSDNEARFKTLERMVDSLEKCIVGDGVRIGRFLFQSQEDLRVWLVSHVPNNRFRLFLDGVSIFDFLAQSHVDNQDNMAHMYNSQKNGFETIYESRVISSMQNLFPNLFGKSGSDGMDTSKTLPAVQNGDKWNSKGVTGLQLQVERELPNVDMQFRNSISATFDSNPEARDLALELLYRSKKFALDLCNFIHRDYDFWKHKGYGKTEAWELTCLSVHHIFEDIHVDRVCGHDS